MVEVLTIKEGLPSELLDVSSLMEIPKQWDELLQKENSFQSLELK